jgi:hypothetical protein
MLSFLAAGFSKPQAILSLSNPPRDSQQTIDPCIFMPSEGKISTQNEANCVSQFSSTPAERVVQISTTVMGKLDNATLCAGLIKPSDYHIMTKEAKVGDCGIQAEVSYQGTPMPGYTGWMVRYYYQGISVRIASSADYPANQTWVYDTAEEIVEIIDNKLGTSGVEETATELPDWIRNPEVPLESKGEEIYVPEWLDWIKPQPEEDNIRGVVRPFFGEAWILNRDTNEWRGPVKNGDFIYSSEVIIIGEDSSVEVIYRNEYGMVHATASDLATLAFDSDIPKSNYPILWHLYSGTVKIKREYTGEAMPPEPVITLVGSDFSGITGARSEVVISHDSTTLITDIFLIDGEVDYYNLITAGPEDGSLISGERLTIWGDGTEMIQPFEQSELDNFLAERNFSEGEPLDTGEIEQLLGENGSESNQKDDNTRTIVLIVLGALVCFGTLLIIIGIVVFLVIRSRKKNLADVDIPEE